MVDPIRHADILVIVVTVQGEQFKTWYLVNSEIQTTAVLGIVGHPIAGMYFARRSSERHHVALHARNLNHNMHTTNCIVTRTKPR